MSYKSRTKPYPHQAEWTPRTQELTGFAAFWEMGLGKSKLALDTAGHLFTEGKINGMLILAPNGVAPNWIHDEIPLHLGVPHRMLLWQSKKVTTKWFQKELQEFLAAPQEELLILVMNYEAILTERKKAGLPLKGRDATKKFLTSRRVLYVLDESARIKSPGTRRTKRILGQGRKAAYRRVMTGTPVDNSPLDVYTQLKFLDPDVWKQVGCESYESFKTRYGVFKFFQDMPPDKEHPEGGMREVERFDRSRRSQCFEKCVEYRNLDELNRIVMSMGSRLLKDDVLDLPPKVYTKRYFDLTPEQTKLYNKLRTEFMIELDSGDIITAPLAITRILRFQQLTSGYIPIDDEGDGPKTLLVDPNPRIKLLGEVLEDVQGQAIIWGKFTRDLEQIAALLDEMGLTHCTYYGATKPDDREEARRGFRSGKYRFFVANPACAGEGLTLTEAKTVIYYNSSYKLGDRLQSEDRAHRIGQDKTVNYIDLIASNTIDGKIVAALRKKLSYARIVMGDSAREWI